MGSKEIYDGLINHSKDECVASFLKELFEQEYNDLYFWNDVYDELIDKYAKECSNED